MKTLLVLLPLFAAFSGLSFASNIPLEKVPPLFQIQVLQSESNPQHYIMLGKDGIYGDAGNWYVLDLKDGQLTSPELTGESYFWYGGGFNFRLVSGEWLYLPPNEAMPGALNEILRAGLISAERGREPLRSLKVTEKLLKDLGLHERVSPDFFKDLSKRQSSKIKKVRAPRENLVLLTLDVEDARSKGKEIGELDRKFGYDQNVAVNVQGVYGSDVRHFYIWAFESQIGKIEAWTKANLGLVPQRHVSLLEGEPPASSENPLARLREMVANFEKLEAQSAEFGQLDLVGFRNGSDLLREAAVGPAAEARVSFAREVDYLIRSVGALKSWLIQVDYNLKSLWSGSDAARAQWQSQYGAPMQAAVDRLYGLIAKTYGPEAREVLFYGGENRLAPSPRLIGQYFQPWLADLLARVRKFRTATAEERKQMSGSSRSGSILNEFGFIGAETRSYIDGPKAISSYGFPRDAFPLLALGMEDSAANRAALVSFIVSMDKEAEYQRRTLGDADARAVSGNGALLQVIQAMVYQGDIYGSSPSAIAEGFSQALYYQQVMAVLSELLDTSRLTITNSLTYLALLDASLLTQRTVELRFGALPNRGKATPELDGLTEELLRLQRSLQVRLMRAVYAQKDIETCKRALLPQ